jgi:nucleoside-diphosphate-sugar epimerase
MRVFVAGATGAIGRPLVPLLLAAGHEVTGLTRSHERAAELRAAGAEAVVADALDPAALDAALASAAPEAVVHQLTELPAAYERRALAEGYARTNRLRREGTANLVHSSRAHGVHRLVAQSIAFLYAPAGDSIKDEDAPPYLDAPEPFGQAVAGCVDLEHQVTAASDLEGTVLRYGFFYGPGTHYARDGGLAEQVRRRRFPVVGSGEGLFSFIHVEDAAAATVAALERGRPGVYNVVDDEPAPLREWLPVYAAALGAKPPRRVPAFVARLAAGRMAAEMATALRGASNAKARAELGWAPAHPSWRTGLPASLGGPW